MNNLAEKPSIEEILKRIKSLPEEHAAYLLPRIQDTSRYISSLEQKGRDLESQVQTAIFELDLTKREFDETIESLKFDPATDVYTKAAGIAEYKKIMGRTSGPVAILFLDMNGLKDYNNKMSHEQGDKALQIFAQTIKDTLGNFGFTSENSLIMKYDMGDEFIITLPNCDEEDTEMLVKRIAKAIRKAEVPSVDERVEMPESFKNLSASLGFFVYKPELKAAIETEVEQLNRSIKENKMSWDAWVLYRADQAEKKAKDVSHEIREQDLLSRVNVIYKATMNSINEVAKV